MTRSEQAEEIGQVVMDHSEAKRRLNCLCSKRERIARDLITVGQAPREGQLQYLPGFLIYSEKSYTIPTVEELANS